MTFYVSRQRLQDFVFETIASLVILAAMYGVFVTTGWIVLLGVGAMLGLE